MPEHAPLTAGNPPVEPQPPQDLVPVTFKEVFQGELTQIAESRQARRVSTSNPTADNLVGLAFSGGGIRSATFNLGILQALAGQKLLHCFDYLSTVSGGGYTGSWLAGVTQRAQTPGDFGPVEEALRTKTYEVGKPAENPAIRWLRKYADYLTPQTGLFSADTGAMLGTWLRNVILNQIVIVLFLMGTILLPTVLVLFTWNLLRLHAVMVFCAGAILLVVATVIMSVSMVDFVPWAEHQKKNWFVRNRVQLCIALFFAAAWLMNGGMWAWNGIADGTLLYWIMGGAGFYFLVWSLAFVISKALGRTPVPGQDEAKMFSWPALLGAAFASGTLGGLLLNRYGYFLAGVASSEGNIWRVIIFGSVALMLLMQFVAVLQLGFLGRGCLDLVREWWARAGGQLILVILAWVAIFGIVVFGPLGVRMVLNKYPRIHIPALGAWMASTLGGVLASKSARTGGEKKAEADIQKAGRKFKFSEFLKSPRVLDFVAKAAPYVFAIGLLVLLSTVIHIGTGLYCSSDEHIRTTTKTLWNLDLKNTDIWRSYWTIQTGAQLCREFLAALVLMGLALGMSLRVDVNDFSMHHFYRNRLVRCYLGASNRKRKPQSYTGFDPHDDVPLGELIDGYPGLYPILNASLNVTHGGELGFQERKAKSFIFTPLYCGYDLAAELAGSSGSQSGSYLPTALGRTDKLGSSHGLTLGTAMAVSGAAASPNMGHYTSPATAFFMTLFDVRLGWWMGNSRYATAWKSSGPRLGLAYLLSELVAHSDEQSRHVYLSDGGHFENLAIYELVKRRCRVIVACDCGADGGYGCGDLMSAIEKCRTDFGVDIKISVTGIKPESGKCVSLKDHTVGEIHYGPGPNDHGTLIYIKSSLPIDDPAAPLPARLAAGVRSYAEAHADFPHQSTADQWFDEVQFEAYRSLGEYIGNTAAVDIRAAIAAVV